MKRGVVLIMLLAIGLVASVTASSCDSPPAVSVVKDCCSHDSLISSDIVDKCKSYLNGGAEPQLGGPMPAPGGQGGNPPPLCYFECVLNETGILQNQNINEANLGTYLSTALSAYPEYIPLVQKTFVTCAAKENQMPARPPMAGDMCNKFAAKVMHCAEKETFINCPASIWKNDDVCNNAKDFFKNCKPPHHHHH